MLAVVVWASILVSARAVRFNAPQCDLVKVSRVDVNPDQNSNTLTVSFGLDKKTTSYEIFTTINRYMVRHGVEDDWGAPISEYAARYTLVDKVSQGPLGPPTVERPTSDNNPYPGLDGGPYDGSNSLNRQLDSNPGDGYTFEVSRIRMDSTYAIVLLVLSIVAIVSSIAACVWIAVLRKRLNATKTAPLDFEPNPFAVKTI